MAVVAGISSSLHSTVIEVRDTESGDLLASSLVPHERAEGLEPGEAVPKLWWQAVENACSTSGHHDLAAVSIAAPLHALVALDAAGEVIRPALLAEDQRSAPDADWCTGKIPPGTWSATVGAVPSEALTVTKLSWLHRSEPEAWGRIASLCSMQDYLTWNLCGGGSHPMVTDRGGASGTGYWSARRNGYDTDVLSLIDGDRQWDGVLPSVIGSLEAAGSWRSAKVAPGTGDVMAMALALAVTKGDVVVSLLGQRVVVFGASDEPIFDESGTISSFAAAGHGYLPTVALPLHHDQTSTGVLAAIRSLRNASVATGGRLIVVGSQNSVIDVALRCSRAEGCPVELCTDPAVVAAGAARQAAGVVLGTWPDWPSLVTDRA